MTVDFSGLSPQPILAHSIADTLQRCWLYGTSGMSWPESTNGVIMRQHKINNEFIYNESLREITSLRSNAAFKMTFMRAWCLSYLIETHIRNWLSVKVSRTQFGESEVNLLAMLIWRNFFICCDEIYNKSGFSNCSLRSPGGDKNRWKIYHWRCWHTATSYSISYSPM